MILESRNQAEIPNHVDKIHSFRDSYGPLDDNGKYIPEYIECTMIDINTLR